MSKRQREAESLKRRKFVRQNFRRIVRNVALNKIWLMDFEDQNLTLNVKKNIAMLVRTQRKIGILTLTEKSMFRTHHSLRTIQDRKKLTSLVANLNCFSSLSPKIRARLVPHIRFMYVTPGRKIIREGDEPSTIYFILNGEVELTKKMYDSFQKTYIDKVQMINGPGDVLGDIELVENCPRMHSYTSSSEVELLVLFEDEFDHFLRPIMSQQWNWKKTALVTLNYFNYFTNDQIISACKLAQLKQFDPLETIYFEDKGQVSFVYFVVSGECMILQCLKMKVTPFKKGVKHFELTETTNGGNVMFQNLSNTEVFKKLKQEELLKKKQNYDVDIDSASDPEIQTERTKRSFELRNMDIQTIEKSCGIKKPVDDEKQNAAITDEEHLSDRTSIIVEENMCSEQIFSEELLNSEHGESEALFESDVELEVSEDNVNVSETDNHNEEDAIVEEPDVNPIEPFLEETQIPMMESNLTNFPENLQTLESSDKEDEEYENDNQSTENNEDHQTPLQSQRLEPPFTSKTKHSKRAKCSQQTIENHFIDVGSLTFGGIFGLGEKLEHRVIMARTTVQCLMLPRFWLFEKEQNPGNIWQRRQFYLDTTVPSRAILFKDFLRTRKWHKFKTSYINSILESNTVPNATKVQDIPIVCRIVEEVEEE